MVTFMLKIPFSEIFFPLNLTLSKHYMNNIFKTLNFKDKRYDLKVH